MSDNIYFTVTAGSPAAAIIDRFHLSITAQREWVRKFERRHKLTGLNWVAWNDAAIIGFAPKESSAWPEFLRAHPLWRRVDPRRGCAYAVPRKIGAEAKALAKEWDGRPRIVNTDWIKCEITGTDWSDWLEGMTSHGMGWRRRDDGSYIAVLPYRVTKAKAFTPVDGLAVGPDQGALREEWHRK